MRTDIQPLAGRQDGGSEMVEEHERTNIAARGEGQQPAHGEPAKIALAGIDDQVDCFGHGVSFRVRHADDEYGRGRAGLGN